METKTTRNIIPENEDSGNSSGSFRPPLRQALRDEDPLAAAEKRAQEIRKHLNGSLDEGTDKYYIDPTDIPPGWVYEWKRRTVLGQEDPAYQVALARTGWETVPASRHPHMMPQGSKWDTIERDGVVLMQRPEAITNEFRNIDYRRARDQVRVKEQQLSSAPDGQFGRDHAQVKPKISKGYEPMPVPKD
ncbi:hypothetical protein EBT31_19875 [bacterium]|nr:hypothetical protein [bacterium]NBX50885.1 hypothetical protein [bacterium]